MICTTPLVVSAPTMALLERAESLPQDLSARVLPPTVYEALFFFLCKVAWKKQSGECWAVFVVFCLSRAVFSPDTMAATGTENMLEADGPK